MKRNWVPPSADLMMFLLPILVMTLSVEFLTLLHWIHQLDPSKVFVTALIIATIGTITLFLARLPLYRQGLYFKFGPRLLDTPHRRLYGTAYGLVGVATLVLLDIFFKLR